MLKYCTILIKFYLTASKFNSYKSLDGELNPIALLTREAYPQVIGHAGASGYVPESTIIGYDLAANLYADYSEPDLVLTKDGEFVAMHDLTLEGTTNVADFPEYAQRISTFVIEGKAITGYYAINFTLSEIKNLRVRQRFDTRTKLYDWLFPVPSLEDILNWQIEKFNETGRLVGIYPELKHPDWYGEMVCILNIYFAVNLLLYHIRCKLIFIITKY